MKIIEAINQLDSLQKNTYSQSDKVRWLSGADLMVWRLIIGTHMKDEDSPEVFTGYDDSTPTDTEMLAYAPFDQMYQYWLEAHIDYENGEYDRYNSAITEFNSWFTKFRNDYNAHHLPLQAKFKL